MTPVEGKGGRSLPTAAPHRPARPHRARHSVSRIRSVPHQDAYYGPGGKRGAPD